MKPSVPYSRIKQILVVEDDPSIRAVMGLMLEALGLGTATISVENGAEAIRIMEAKTVDLLITDFRMPEMDGVQLLNWCRERHLHIPVIFVSADAELIDRERVALEDCCATLMNKPMTLDNLVTAIHAAERLIHHPDCVHNRATPL